MRLHLDTDFGGDTDDACALAYLLSRRDVDLVGLTTVAHRTAGATAGRPAMPCRTTCSTSSTTRRPAPSHSARSR